jgi:hypothetical protein
MFSKKKNQSSIVTLDGDYNNLRKSADIAMFMCGPTCATSYYCGQSSGGFNANNTNLSGEQFVRDGSTFGIVIKDCARNSFAFGHEASHLFGCDHNREEVNPKNPDAPLGYGFGYLMRPPANSGYCTILASVKVLFILFPS